MKFFPLTNLGLEMHHDEEVIIHPTMNLLRIDAGIVYRKHAEKQKWKRQIRTIRFITPSHSQLPDS